MGTFARVQWYSASGSAATVIDFLRPAPKLHAMTGLRRFFNRETTIGLGSPVHGAPAERVKRMAAKDFVRLYRTAGNTIKSVEVLPPRLGDKGFGELKVVIRGREHALPKW